MLCDRPKFAHSVAALVSVLTLSALGVCQAVFIRFPANASPSGRVTAYGVNNARTVVGQELYDFEAAVYWTPDGVRHVTFVSGHDGLYGINDLNQMAGYRDRHAVVLTPGQPLIDLHGLLPGGLMRSMAVAINTAGTTLISATDNSTWRSFTIQGTFLQELLRPAGSSSAVGNNLNEAGVVVGAADNNGMGDGLAVRWDAGVPTVLPPLPGNSYAYALDINTHGAIVGASFHTGGNDLIPVVWADGQPSPLPLLPGYTGGQAMRINRHGQIVGDAFQPNGARHPFLYQGGVIIDLNSLVPAGSDLELFEPCDLNDAGAVVGWGVTSAGRTMGYLLVPEHPGDLNCDGETNFDDINPFVQALTDPNGWRESYPACPPSNGDLNRDGRVDFADVNPFVALLGNG